MTYDQRQEHHADMSGGGHSDRLQAPWPSHALDGRERASAGLVTDLVRSRYPQAKYVSLRHSD